MRPVPSRLCSPHSRFALPQPSRRRPTYKSSTLALSPKSRHRRPSGILGAPVDHAWPIRSSFPHSTAHPQPSRAVPAAVQLLCMTCIQHWHSVNMPLGEPYRQPVREAQAAMAARIVRTVKRWKCVAGLR
ncbi:hypothetical protein FA95DRAFT_1395643 [Auriscalpium vulgare]|uniref:Uncharacterized protein n=1 Tax=Auriscalpium vulgare TaxID=40419 RepID=A0ACB8RR65_9AGAM|nr:hypothetical protein FA95DRAFT_1395643 [Auriscalpium vulgare]